MVFSFKIDGSCFGGYLDRQALHDALVERDWFQLVPESDVYIKRVNGVMTGAGKIIQTPKILGISKLPKS